MTTWNYSSSNFVIGRPFEFLATTAVGLDQIDLDLQMFRGVVVACFQLNSYGRSALGETGEGEMDVLHRPIDKRE